MSDVDTSDESARPAAGDDEARPELGVRRKRRRRSSQRNAVEWIVVVGGALLVAVLIKTFLFQAFYIPSASMEPTLAVGDRVLVNKLSYDLHDVHRGDIVVFSRPPETGQTVQSCDGKSVTIPAVSLSKDDVDDLIKRVIALPGEKVEQRNDGHIYINGTLLNEPYVKATAGPPRTAWSYSPQCIVVPDHHVFVMGDNGTNSEASNAFGPIDESLIVGRAFVRVWPPGSIGGL